MIPPPPLLPPPKRHQGLKKRERRGAFTALYFPNFSFWGREREYFEGGGEGEGKGREGRWKSPAGELITWLQGGVASTCSCKCKKGKKRTWSNLSKFYFRRVGDEKKSSQKIFVRKKAISRKKSEKISVRSCYTYLLPFPKYLIDLLTHEAHSHILLLAFSSSTSLAKEVSSSSEHKKGSSSS